MNKLTDLCFFLHSPLSWPPSISRDKDRSACFLRSTATLGFMSYPPLSGPLSVSVTRLPPNAHPCSSTLCLSVHATPSLILNVIGSRSPCLGLYVFDKLFTCWSLILSIPKMGTEYCTSYRNVWCHGAIVNAITTIVIITISSLTITVICSSLAELRL